MAGVLDLDAQPDKQSGQRPADDPVKQVDDEQAVL
jgi:hypothetical protein